MNAYPLKLGELKSIAEKRDAFGARWKRSWAAIALPRVRESRDEQDTKRCVDELGKIGRVHQ